MTPRADQAQAFLSTTDWASVPVSPLAGDASNRKYFRLIRPNGHTAVLMDADPAKGEDVRPFLHVAAHLAQIGLSAPTCLAQDIPKGFLLLEDLGDALFARVVAKDPALETPLYEAATDALVTLHANAPASGLKPYDPAVMTAMAALAWRWYRSGALGADAARETAFTEAFKPLLDTYVRETPVMILRDYHAENLLWLPARQGPARAGQLDFQDAMLGHPAYDLVSLLQDARRDVSSDVAEAMVRHYCHQTNSNHSDFTTAYHLLGAQRNLRILGVFARLSLMAGKPHYIDLIPRVWAHLMHDLAHPALAPVAALIRADLPEPTPALLQRLKDLCGTVPAP